MQHEQEGVKRPTAIVPSAAVLIAWYTDCSQWYERCFTVIRLPPFLRERSMFLSSSVVIVMSFESCLCLCVSFHFLLSFYSLFYSVLLVFSSLVFCLFSPVCFSFFSFVWFEGRVSFSLVRNLLHCNLESEGSFGHSNSHMSSIFPCHRLKRLLLLL